MNSTNLKLCVKDLAGVYHWRKKPSAMKVRNGNREKYFYHAKMTDHESEISNFLVNLGTIYQIINSLCYRYPFRQLSPNYSNFFPAR